MRSHKLTHTSLVLSVPFVKHAHLLFGDLRRILLQIGCPAYEVSIMQVLRARCRYSETVFEFRRNEIVPIRCLCDLSAFEKTE